jgi:prepilin-type N-terminal cleavage/methylation domain-containing protein
MVRVHRQAGFTLVELMLVMGVLGLVFGAMGTFQVRSQQASDAGIARAETEARARRVLARVVDELSGVAQSRLVPDPTGLFGTSDLRFQRPMGVVNGSVAWGTQARLQLVPDSQRPELRNLVLVPNTSASKSIVLCKGVTALGLGESSNGIDDDGDGQVDEAGFSVQRVGDLLTIQITLVLPDKAIGAEAIEHSTATVLKN